MGGLFGGGLSHAFPEIKTHTIKSFEDMSARWFMIAFIAPIMFAEGYGLKSRAISWSSSRNPSPFFGLFYACISVLACEPPSCNSFVSCISMRVDAIQSVTCNLGMAAGHHQPPRLHICDVDKK